MDDSSRLALDRDFISARSAFLRAKKVAANYGARLRKVARHIDDLIRGFDASTVIGQTLIQSALHRYRETIHPWAEATADRFVKEVAASDRNSWRKMSAEIGRSIEKEISSAPIAPVMERMKQEQVLLITSLPRDAAERVNKIATEGLSKGRRAEDIAKEIYETGHVTRSRATTIARTESGRVATTFTKARAEHIGSTHFVWVTAGDGTVRPSHKKLNGLTFRWDDPPVCDAPDLRALPGAIFNCRCIPRPVISD